MRASNVVLIAAAVTFFALVSGLLIGAFVMPWVTAARVGCRVGHQFSASLSIRSLKQFRCGL
jgi:hypothetical protein